MAKECSPGDTCNPATGSCEPTPCTSDADCDDGDACTTDTCNAGVCSSTDVSCDDKNLCTIDWCDPFTGCVNMPKWCSPGEACDPATGNCGMGPCTIDADCNDWNDCTTDTCNAGVCENAPVSCDDANACTIDFCNSYGGCVNMPKECSPGDTCNPVTGNCEPVPPAGCTSDAECDDSNPCSMDTCNVGVCEYAPVSCDDANACTIDFCDPYGGCANMPKDCSPGDACNPATGNCEPIAPTGCASDAECDDGNACTADVCNAGACENVVVSCDDVNMCTIDFCDPLGGGCVNMPITGCGP